MGSTKKPLADALKMERPELDERLTIRISKDDRRLLTALEKHTKARSTGEVVRFALRRLAEEAGIK